MIQAKSRGIALISVLFIAAVVLILASTFVYMIYRERQATTATRLISDSLQVADAITERARLEMIHTFGNSYLTAPSFVKQINTVLDGGTSKIPSINAYVNAAQAVTINDKTGYWKIVGASEVEDVNFPPEIMYIDIAATSETGGGVQTIIRRINMGQSKTFDLAMLSERTDCIYCHLQVNGDVGALGDLRPGWGIEGVRGHGSGGSLGGSMINGTAFIAGSASNDDTDLSGTPDKINGALFEDAIEGYRGNRLPKDENGDGIPDFPPLKKEIGLENTEGSISGGKIYTIPHGTTLASIPTIGALPALTGGKYDGNVILEGTKDNPLIIDGDMYFSGDVIIKGYVKGRGAINSGRNTYVAGNINYIDPPANCATAGNPDTCAQNALSQNKDELRLASRGNIVLGDYTEYNLDGTRKTWQELQASDYFRKQFGFSNCYNKQTNDELRFRDGKYFDVDGDEIAGSNVVCPPNQDSNYNYTMRPGRVNADGSFSTWLSDGLYKQILGTEQRTYDLWRHSVERSSLTAADVAKQFAKYNLSTTSLNDILTRVTPGGFDITNVSGDVIGYVNWENGFNTIHVIIDRAFSYEKQITHVDAFMYANQRIAGKTFNAPLVINGGVIAKEIGILAPGIERPRWALDSRYDFIGNLDMSSKQDCGTESFVDNFLDDVDVNGDGVADSDDDAELSPLYQPDSEDCALTINYDYRLRNGGLGFNLISSVVGQTLTWQIADDASQQVRP
jgi:hypothetical protein